MTEIQKAVSKVLTNHYWLPTLDINTCYSRRHDDTDGDFGGNIFVTFSKDGDAWIRVDTSGVLRFRTGDGGGQSLKTRAALLILAEAIRQDNIEHPQRRA